VTRWKLSLLIPLGGALVAIFFAAAPASASVLCVANEAKCASENNAGVPTTFETELSAGVAKFEGSLASECTKSELGGQLTKTEAASKPLTGQITTARFEGCSSCKKIEALKLPWSAELTSTGTLTAKSPEILMESCTALKVTCKFSAESISVSFSGGSPAAIKASAVTLKGAGGACTSEKLSANYELTDPNNGTDWISEGTGSTTMCAAEPEKNEAKELICPKGKGFSGEIEGTLEKEKPATFKSSEGTITCNEGSLAGTLSENGTGTITSLTYGSSGGACTSTLPGSPKVTVEAGNLSYNRLSIGYTQPPAPQARIIVGGDPGRPMRRMRIGLTPECIYGFSQRTERWTNGPPAPGMEIEITWVKTAEIPLNTPAICPTPITDIEFMPVRPPGGGQPPKATK
jgi:hypothetical protein